MAQREFEGTGYKWHRLKMSGTDNGHPMCKVDRMRIVWFIFDLDDELS